MFELPDMNDRVPMEDLQTLHSHISGNSSDPQLVLIRGLPGSGKSTLAASLKTKGYLHIETDMYFEVRGKYVFRRSKSAEAHTWCQRSTQIALKMGRKVVVSNTFIKLSDMVPFQKMTENVLIFEATGSWKNVHGVSFDALKQMASKWETFG
jgi:energy-coupling factor transporter ATP-binding protein EcfA2